MSHQALIRRLRTADRTFYIVGLLCTLLGLLVVAVLMGALIWQGAPALNWHFLTSMMSSKAAKAGILTALVGSLCVIVVTITVSIPLGVAAAIYLEEYAKKNWLTAFIEINISNLAGVPSIVFGLMALSMIVHNLKLGETIFVAGITLGLLVLPVIIVSTREALRAIPQSIREAAFAMGATRWQVIRYHLLPYSAGGIATGMIIAVSRALGETAPLVIVGVKNYVSELPPSPVQATAPFVNFRWLSSDYTVLPYQMFDWVQRPEAAFQPLAAAAGLVLIVLTVSLNGVAIYLRYHVRRQIKW